MEARPKDAGTVDPVLQGSMPTTIGSQPWWRVPGFSAISHPVLPEGASKSSSNIHNGGGGAAGGASQPQDRINDGVDVSKEMQNIGTHTGSDGSYGQEQQHLQPGSSAMPPGMTEYVVPHTQLELGQSIACPAFPYSDPYGMMAAYGTQGLVHPHLIGMPHTRMPLPLEMAEEPVYVNAKQYHGILRRRQSRAKAELEKKVIKVRKPYLHESRHQHAMRRARGCGGRFLNAKKAENNVKKAENSAANSDPNPEGFNSGIQTQSTSSSGSEAPPSGFSGNVDSASTMHEAKDSSMQEDCADGNEYIQNSGFQLSAFHSMSGERVEEGDCLGQQRGGMLVNRPPNRAVAIQ